MAKRKSTASKAPVRCELGDGAALVSKAVGKNARRAVEQRVEEIHQGFMDEFAKGWDHEAGRLRAWALAHERADEIAQIADVADRARKAFKVFVTVGIGGSDLAQRTIHDALNDPHHNERVAAGVADWGPEVYFTGNTFDPRALVSLLDMLEARDLLTDTVFNVVSKSGRTAETISAMLLARDRVMEAYRRDAKLHNSKPDPDQCDPDQWRNHIIATTGPHPHSSVLKRMNDEKPFFGILPIPDGIGGRFSAVCAVGLLFLGVTARGKSAAKRIDKAVAGLAAGHRAFRSKPFGGKNPACELARWLHLAETRCAKSGIVFYNYADMPKLGEWFLQLYTESIQERNAGLSVTPVTGPTGNHSILNGIIGGPRDRVVLMVGWDDLGVTDPESVTIPRNTGVGGDLEVFEGVPLDKAQEFSLEGTIADFTENGVPNCLLRVGRRDEKSLFRLLRTLMDAVAVKGRLQNLDHAPDRDGESGELTYQQDGVEGYKKKTLALAKEWKKSRRKKQARGGADKHGRTRTGAY